MPVPDETNNFATHGKAPIPSNANGSFVVPHNKEPEIKTPVNSAPATAAPPVVTAPPVADPTSIVAPPAGAAFVSAPPANATMTPVAAQTPVMSVSPFAPPPMAQQPIQQQPMMPLAIPQQMPMQMPQQVIPSEPRQIIPSVPQGDGIPMPLPQPQPQMQAPMPMQQMPMQSPQEQQQQLMQQMQQQMVQIEQQMQQMQQLQQQQQMQQMQMQAPMPMQQMQAPMPAPIQPATPQYSMTPARIADMQAEILAKALISSQTAGIRPRQKQTYKKSAPEEQPDYEEPTQQDIRDKNPVTTQMPSNITHGERIILPIHDITLQQQREDMSRRMTELLGDEETELETISTKSMKKKQKEMAKMKVRNATQASEDIQMTPEQAQAAQQQAAAAAAAQQQDPTTLPTPADLFPEYTLSGEAIAPQAPLIDPLNNPRRAPVAPVQQQPTDQPAQVFTLETQVQPEAATSAEEQQNYVEQEYRPQTPESSYDITSQMQDAQLPTLESDQEVRSMDPRIAAIQQQQLMQIEEKKKLEEQQALQAQQQAALQAQQQAQMEQQAHVEQQVAQQQAAQGQPQVQAQSGRLNPNRKSIRVNADVVKKAALASILKRATPEPEPEAEPVEAIRPAYVEELETQLASDMKSTNSELDTLMAAELADDEITANAKQIKAANQEEERKAAASLEMPDEIMKAIESTSPVSAANPNIGSSDLETLET